MWTQDEIETALIVLSKKHGRMPTILEIREAKKRGLEQAIYKHKLGYSGFAKKLCLPTKRKYTKWSVPLLEKEILSVAKDIGRMPSVEELRKIGKNDLACKIAKSTEGFRGWAKKLGLSLKNSETKIGVDNELWVKDELENRGHIVKHTRARESFDLLVDGSKKVEVKIARIHVSKNVTQGYIFSLGKHPQERDIDFLILVCADSNYSPIKTYVLPKTFAQQQTITITRADRWCAYLEAWDLLTQVGGDDSETQTQKAKRL